MDWVEKKKLAFSHNKGKSYQDKSVGKKAK